MWLFSLSPLKASFSEVWGITPRQMYNLGSFPNSSLKSTRYSALAPLWKFLSPSQSAWLAGLTSRQLSRSWVDRNPSIMTEIRPASVSVCRAYKAFLDRCTHFTQAKCSTDVAAAWIRLNKAVLWESAKSWASLHRVYEGGWRVTLQLLTASPISTVFPDAWDPNLKPGTELWR